MIEATSDAQRELIPAGNYIARCVSMIHIGTNKESTFGPEKDVNKVRVGWELPGEIHNEKPLRIEKEYTLSMHAKSNLRKDLESWRGLEFTKEQAKSFDVTKLLGAVCMLNVTHKTAESSGNEYDAISAVTPLPKAVSCPAQVNPNFEFNYTDKFDQAIIETLPDFIANKIKTSTEYVARMNPENAGSGTQATATTTAGEATDDLPF